MSEPEQSGQSREWIRYLSLGMEIAAALTIPIAAGYWIDTRLESSPWFLLVGALFGILILIGMMIRIARPGGR